MAIIEVHQLPNISIVRNKNERTGFRGITITKQYRLVVESPTEVPGTHPDFPNIGDTLNYEGFVLRCKANPVSGQDPKLRTFHYASATFDNYGDSGDKDITEQFPEKTWRPVEFREMVTDAEFLGVFDEELDIISGLTPDGLAIGDKTPIVNSAKVPRPKERTLHGRQFRIVQYFADFDPDWEGYQDKYNSDTFTISQSDRTGVKWSFTFQPRTCLMKDVGITEERLDNGLIYFRVTWNFIQHPKSWVHYEVDVGRKYRYHVGQYKPDGTQFDQTDLDSISDGNEGYREFTTKVLDGTGADTGKITTVSEPIKMNGYGQAYEVTSPVANNAQTLFLGFLEQEEKPFAVLNM